MVDSKDTRCVPYLLVNQKPRNWKKNHETHQAKTKSILDTAQCAYKPFVNR